MNELPNIYPVACHTDNVGPCSTFVAIAGMKADGCTYIPLAVAQGATRIVVDEHAVISADCSALLEQRAIPLLRVANTRKALAQLSAQAWDYPAHKLKIIGITGTKGKTTSSFVLAHLLAHSGYATALLSTVHNKIIIGEQETIFPTTLTTQHPDYLHMFLAHCVTAGVEYVVMEVAAQAVSLWRVEGIPFYATLFTNFAQEHGEFYASQQEYFAAKCQLLTMAPPEHVFINADDQYGQQLLAQHPYRSFGVQTPADIAATITRNDRSGITFVVQDVTYHSSTLLGSYNISNLLGALAVGLSCGIDPQKLQVAAASFTKVPGRLEQYRLPNAAIAVIDYAHNPSSFQMVLLLLRDLSPHLVVVFGCGGDRDASKRPVMGALAAELADQVFLTTDNPRSETPEKITEQIYAGIPEGLRHKVAIELDRERAIRQAYNQAGPQSIIALLGKGPDEYQIIGTTKVPFSEKAILQSLQTCQAWQGPLV